MELTNQSPRYLNLPNALCAIRLVLSAGLVPVALYGEPRWFIALFLLAAATDFVDGTLAKWLRQQTSFGARLDSLADAAMYSALLFGCAMFQAITIANESAWIGTALIIFALSCAASLAKFRRLPSYHSYSAKAAWFVTMVAALVLLSGWAVWPLRVAMVAVGLANFEAVLITLRLSECRSDVLSIWHAGRT